MASTYSSNLGIELIGSGEQSGTWGTTTNNNLGTLLEQAICGYGAAAVTTGNTTTITMPNGASGTARNMVISVTGTGGASTVLAVPDSRTKIYTIFNGATGAITVRTVSGSGISVPTSTKAILYCDGTNVVDAVNYFSSLTLGAALPVASGGTGLATLTANNVILGSGTSSPTFVAPTTSGNILTANGTTWVSSAPATNGTVTSVGVSGGTTGLTTSGGPITTSGTITLAGTLAVANGGTGVTSTTAYAVYTGNSAGTGFAGIANGTTGQIFTATTSGAPSWSSAFNGTVGASTPTTGKFTTVTATGLYTGGDANLVFAYAGGLLTSSSFITSDGAGLITTTTIQAQTGAFGYSVLGYDHTPTSITLQGLNGSTGTSGFKITSTADQTPFYASTLTFLEKTNVSTYTERMRIDANGITGNLTGNVTGTGTLASGSTISDGATAFSVGYLNIPQNAQSSNYTLVLTDNGKHIYSTNSGAQSITIPTNASVAFPTGTAFTIVNNGTTSITIVTTSLTVYQAGTTNTGDRTLATKGVATCLKVATNTWFISGSGVS